MAEKGEGTIPGALNSILLVIRVCQAGSPKGFRTPVSAVRGRLSMLFLLTINVAQALASWIYDHSTWSRLRYKL